MEDFVCSLQELSATQLMDKKDSIEKDIKELNDVLETQGGVGLQGSLVDREGYPRSDIDVYAVRMARNKIICLQNDHKAVMTEVEKKLHQVHAVARETRVGGGQGEPLSAPEGERGMPTGFAKVNLVAPGSPAANAGIQVEDVIAQFGSIDFASFKTLQDIGLVVQHSIGKPVRVVVIRNQRQFPLSVTPHQWSGPGLLGCNIVPLEAIK